MTKYSLGLNNFNGFNVTSFEIKLEAESDGTNMIGTVYIPNPSVMTISFVCFPLPHIHQLGSANSDDLSGQRHV